MELLMKYLFKTCGLNTGRAKDVSLLKIVLTVGCQVLSH
jgi:hypothetical protein